MLPQQDMSVGLFDELKLYKFIKIKISKITSAQTQTTH